MLIKEPKISELNQVTATIDCLERTPIILKNLIQQIPEELYLERRINGKWSIHEQVCHLVDSQSILMERFKQFKEEQNPLIKSYNGASEHSDEYYLDFSMKTELKKFPRIREEMVNMLRTYDDEYWDLKGRHVTYTPYNTQILLTHALNVDYAHIFSIEQLGLTKPAFEDRILAIP